MLAEILDRLPGDKIPEALLLAAMANNEWGDGVLGLLIASNLDIEITEAMVTGELPLKAGWWKRPEPMQWFSWPRKEQIDREFKIRKAREVMIKAMLDDGPGIRITQEAVAVIARQFSKRIMEILMARDPNFKITEAIVAGAAGNFAYGTEIIRMLFAREPSIEITASIAMAANAQHLRGTGVIEAMLLGGHMVGITEGALIVVAGEFHHQIMRMLLARNPKLEITEAVMAAAAGNVKEMMRMLLARNPTFQITQEVLVISAGNRHGVGMMELVLSRDSNLVISEAVMKAALSNWICGKDLIRMMLSRQPMLLLTKTGVTAAMSDWRNIAGVIPIQGCLITAAMIVIVWMLGQGVIGMLWARYPNVDAVVAAM